MGVSFKLSVVTFSAQQCAVAISAISSFKNPTHHPKVNRYDFIVNSTYDFIECKIFDFNIFYELLDFMLLCNVCFMLYYCM